MRAYQGLDFAIEWMGSLQAELQGGSLWLPVAQLVERDLIAYRETLDGVISDIRERNTIYFEELDVVGPQLGADFSRQKMLLIIVGTINCASFQTSVAKVMGFCPLLREHANMSARANQHDVRCPDQLLWARVFLTIIERAGCLKHRSGLNCRLMTPFFAHPVTIPECTCPSCLSNLLLKPS